MGRRGNANGQEAHEKMFNIANRWGNANQTHNEISPHTSQNGYQKEHKKRIKKMELHPLQRLLFVFFLIAILTSVR